MFRHSLSLAAENAEAVAIARNKKRNSATFTVGGKTIRSVDTIKYLGVTRDVVQRTSFERRLEGIEGGSTTSIIPIIGGQRQPRRSLLSSAVRSVIFYGAPIWADALYSNRSYGVKCVQTCRTVALSLPNRIRHCSLCHPGNAFH